MAFILPKVVCTPSFINLSIPFKYYGVTHIPKVKHLPELGFVYSGNVCYYINRTSRTVLQEGTQGAAQGMCLHMC